MAIAVIGGVITSTFLTLFVVPLVFAAFEKLTPRGLRTHALAPPPPEGSGAEAAPPRAA
jgi:hypothetical protein